VRASVVRRKACLTGRNERGESVALGGAAAHLHAGAAEPQSLGVSQVHLLTAHMAHVKARIGLDPSRSMLMARQGNGLDQTLA